MQKDRSNVDTYEADLVTEITKRIHDSQCKGLVVSPVSIVSAIILYGRATHGVCIGKIKELMEWMRYEIKRNGYSIDWQGNIVKRIYIPDSILTAAINRGRRPGLSHSHSIQAIGWT